MKNKIIYTNWTDVIVAKGQNWQSKILGGYERNVNHSFGIPIDFVELHNLLQELKSEITGDYVFITEKHQNIDPKLSLPGIRGYSESTEMKCYFTETFKIISFLNEEDAILFKLKLEKIDKC